MEGVRLRGGSPHVSPGYLGVLTTDLGSGIKEKKIFILTVVRFVRFLGRGVLNIEGSSATFSFAMKESNGLVRKQIKNKKCV